MTLLRFCLALGLGASAAEALSPPGSRDSATAPLPVPGLLWADGDQSPRAGADNLLFLSDVATRLEDRLLPHRPFGHATWAGWTLSLGVRAGRAALVDLPLAAFLPLLQHEVYGHGYRAREAGYRDIRYELEAPPPYGTGGGLTDFTTPGRTYPSWDHAVTMSMAGVEAEDILAQRVRSRWLRRGEMRGHESLLYFSSSLGLLSYLSVTDPDRDDLSNDMLSYTAYRNDKADGLSPRPDPVDLEDLEEGAGLAALDPFLYLAAWSYARYLVTGDPRWRHPALPLGPARWLPSVGYRLTPWGGQRFVELLASWSGRGLAARWAQGESDLGGYRGLDLEAAGLLAWRGFAVDAAARIWRQPGLWLEPGDPPEGGEAWGHGGELAVVSPSLLRALPLRLGAAAAWKTDGYVPGERLDAGITWRVGLGMHR